jgi:hypothetical protein
MTPHPGHSFPPSPTSCIQEVHWVKSRCPPFCFGTTMASMDKMGVSSTLRKSIDRMKSRLVLHRLEWFQGRSLPQHHGRGRIHQFV